MDTITWQTSAGSLGTYPAGSAISLQLSAICDNLASVVRYKLLSGSLPNGETNNPIVVNAAGVISGIFASVLVQQTYNFTVRAYDQYGNIRDRTFSISVSVPAKPRFTQTSGLLFTTEDSTWIDFPIDYTNPISTNDIVISSTSGEFPRGLYVRNNRIQGYATPPTSSTNDPIIKRYVFTLELVSPLGNDSVVYSVDVINQSLNHAPHNRVPVITNSRPAYYPIPISDPYYGFYCNDNILPTINANQYYSFKFVGKDFDNDAVKYSFGPLPEGLIGDRDTGWITGVPVMNNTGINVYLISVSVSKKSRPGVTSATEVFQLRVLNNIVEDIVWTTPEDLGIIYNNTISELFVNATSSKELAYTLVGGTLPANLTVLDNGLVAGKVAFEPGSSVLNKDEQLTFEFTVLVYAIQQTSLRSTKTFRLTVKQYYTDPIENVYFKISPSVNGRTILNSLLTDDTLIPPSDLYRHNDYYFSKANDIKIIHAYGMHSSSLEQYLSVTAKNHYNKTLLLGDIKTARAVNENGDVSYEVVYSEILDDMVNDNGVSIPQEITWPVDISLNLGPWNINNTNIPISSGSLTVNLSPGSINTLYPVSIENMRNRLTAGIDQVVDNRILPRWMTSQQENGETLGFTRCWVICHTLPGKSSTIRDNINNNWQYTLNQIDCTIDRFMVDKTTTYNWNTNLLIPTWNELPSEVPNYTNPEKHDLPVLFPRKTILPNSNSY